MGNFLSRSVGLYGLIFLLATSGNVYKTCSVTDKYYDQIKFQWRQYAFFSVHISFGVYGGYSKQNMQRSISTI